MFARKNGRNYTLYHDCGNSVTVIHGEDGRNIWPLNNIDDEGGVNKHDGEKSHLSANYESSRGKPFIVTMADVKKLGIEIE